MPKLTSLDHLVLTVADIEATCAFYCNSLGMIKEVFHASDGTIRSALKFGTQKINLHLAGAEFEPKSQRPTPGSADLCFISETPLSEWQIHFADQSIAIEQGPIARTGATGSITSLYIRDPDRNLIEVSVRG